MANSNIQIVQIQLENKTINVPAIRSGDKLWCHYQGQNFCLELSNPSKKKRAGSNLDLGPMYAPMPAKLVRLNVKEGDLVKAKQVLMVLEAMKMEYSISAPKDAKVSKVAVSAGEQLKDSQFLIELIEQDKK